MRVGAIAFETVSPYSPMMLGISTYAENPEPTAAALILYTLKSLCRIVFSAVIGKKKTEKAEQMNTAEI